MGQPSDAERAIFWAKWRMNECYRRPSGQLNSKSGACSRKCLLLLGFAGLIVFSVYSLLSVPDDVNFQEDEEGDIFMDPQVQQELNDPDVEMAIQNMEMKEAEEQARIEAEKMAEEERDKILEKEYAEYLAELEEEKLKPKAQLDKIIEELGKEEEGQVNQLLVPKIEEPPKRIDDSVQADVNFAKFDDDDKIHKLKEDTEKELGNKAERVWKGSKSKQKDKSLDSLVKEKSSWDKKKDKKLAKIEEEKPKSQMNKSKLKVNMDKDEYEDEYEVKDLFKDKKSKSKSKSKSKGSKSKAESKSKVRGSKSKVKSSKSKVKSRKNKLNSLKKSLKKANADSEDDEYEEDGDTEPEAVKQSKKKISNLGKKFKKTKEETYYDDEQEEEEIVAKKSKKAKSKLADKETAKKDTKKKSKDSGKKSKQSDDTEQEEEKPLNRDMDDSDVDALKQYEKKIKEDKKEGNLADLREKLLADSDSDKKAGKKVAAKDDAVKKSAKKPKAAAAAAAADNVDDYDDNDAEAEDDKDAQMAKDGDDVIQKVKDEAEYVDVLGP